MKNEPQKDTPFKSHLIAQGHSFGVAKRYSNYAQHFTEWCHSELLTASELTYTQLMNYIHFEKQKGNKQKTIQQKIISLRHYYNYLQLGHNPALLIKLRRATDSIPVRLLSSDELNELYANYPSHGMINKRDKILLSLAIYQGVSSGELALIELSDLNLNQGTIYIPAMPTTNSRTLELKPFQLMLIQDYVLKVRPKILQEAQKQSEYLLVSTGQSARQLNNVVSKIIKNLHCQSPKFRDFKQIRQSVITDWVTQFGLRKAQYMAGHRYVSSTERYNEDARSELKNALKTMHPMQ